MAFKGFPLSSSPSIKGSLRAFNGGEEERGKPLKPREKIVQKAIAMVLTALYEPHFLEYSHGFRPFRGCHSALKMIDERFRGGKWVIEADITKCFDRIPHDKLLEILSRRISCKKTLALIKSGLKAGYILLGKKVTNEKVGTPQGSVLSPLLANIYLHELDCFMEDLTKQHTKGETRKRNPEYRRVQYEMVGGPKPQLGAWGPSNVFPIINKYNQIILIYNGKKIGRGNMT
ncbi:MAG: reverse transcriptase/maturase family protein, partial [Agrobacterium sp.]|uniref:reverse transcriptase/maturase family protein n=1 Tax=Agrobacterium sp. TaxID=361 RepID=UPI004037E609